MSALTGVTPFGLSVTSRYVGTAAITIKSVPTTPDAECPACRTPSAHLHSRYLRTVADLPSHGRRVVWRVTARRFRCRNGGCVRSVFCERLPEVRPHARATESLVHAQRDVGLALGGEAGSRLCHRLAFSTSGDTLLRRVRAIPPTPAPSPRVLGVDDFAFRKGHTYGTILIDLERRRVIDLLPDRTAATLTAWLKARPGILVVSRDRASAYSQAATEAVLNAVQVADRFHLLVNLREAVERTLQQRTAAIRALVAKALSPTALPPTATGTDVPAAGDVDRRQELFDRVRRLHRDGLSLRRITRELNLYYRTVERYVRSDTCPDWNAGQLRSSGLDCHAEWIRGRLRDGCSAAQVHRELPARGYRSGSSAVREYVRRLRAEMGLAPARAPHRRPPPHRRRGGCPWPPCGPRIGKPTRSGSGWSG